MHKTATLSAILALGFLAAACGATERERAISGGGMGAVGGAVVGGPAGAVLGGAAGAATGALTEQEDIDLGTPLWEMGDDDIIDNE